MSLFAERETLTRLTFDPLPEIYPTWSPDGLKIVFTLRANPRAQLLQKSADGTGSVELLAESGETLLSQTFSPDGTRLILVELEAGNFNLAVRSMDDVGSVEPLL